MSACCVTMQRCLSSAICAVVARDMKFKVVRCQVYIALITMGQSSDDEPEDPVGMDQISG